MAVLIYGIPWWQERPLRKADAAIRSGHAEEALAIVDRFLNENPNHEPARAIKARAMVKLGRAAEAMMLIDQVGAATVDEMHAYAEAALMLHRWSVALPVLEHLTQLQPDSADFLHELSACRAKLGKYDDAIKAAQQFSALPGYEARGYTLIGMLERDRGNHQKCREAWAKVVSLRADASDLQITAAEFFREYGKVLLLSGEPRLAVPEFQRSVSLEESGDSLALLGKALAQSGQPEQAETAFTKSLERQQDNPVAREGLAELRMQRGQFADALEVLKPVTEATQIKSTTGFLMQRLHALLNQPEESQKWKERTEVLRKQEEARVNMEQVIVNSPDTMWGQVFQAYTLAEQDNREEALRLLAPWARDDSPVFVLALWNALQQQTKLPGLETVPIETH